MILKQVIRYTNADALEATWVEEIDGQEVVVKCQAYANSQMDLLAADLGADAPQYQVLMDEVAATYVPPPPPAPEQIMAEIVAATQSRLDTFARTRNYDGILSACTYATSSVPKFAAEGQYCVDARDATWATLYQIMAEVQAGTRPMPAGYDDVAGDLPVLAWPQ